MFTRGSMAKVDDALVVMCCVKICRFGSPINLIAPGEFVEAHQLAKSGRAAADADVPEGSETYRIIGCDVGMIRAWRPECIAVIWQ